MESPRHRNDRGAVHAAYPNAMAQSTAHQKQAGGCWYELIARIRAGTLGTVHVACKRGAPASEPVAVKRLHPHLVNDQRARRMLSMEVEIGKRLAHENTARVHELFDLGFEPLLVMEYVEGASLAELLQIWPVLPPPVALCIVLDAAMGLVALHRLVDELGQPLRAVHRGVSPRNLLVGRDGRTRIAGYGSACTATLPDGPEPRPFSRRSCHRAPEHVVGYACDARTDVFSLAAVAWELLTARPLFEGPTDASTMQRIVSMRAPKLSSLVPDLGDALDEVLERALAKNPEDRFPTMERFGSELADAAAWTTGIARHSDVGATVEDLVGDALACRRADIEDQLPTSGVYARPQL